MPKLTILFVLCFSPLAQSAETTPNPCKIKENALNEMNLITSNLSNLNTTRTPEGGPYKMKEWVCKGTRCQVRENLRVLRVYEPSHIDADKNGLVSYPNIPLQQQMKAFKKASAVYNEAKKNCPE